MNPASLASAITNGYRVITIDNALYAAVAVGPSVWIWKLDSFDSPIYTVTGERCSCPVEYGRCKHLKALHGY